jgi:hypothetical protein
VGAEVKCRARLGKQVSEGKALLETKELIFRGEFRLKIAFAEMKSVKAVDGELRVEFAAGKAAFELGAQAEKWAQKILHPKTRMEKLGIKAGAKVSAIGEFEKEFERELAEVTKAVTRGKVPADAEWIFLRSESAKELAQSAKVAKALKGSAGLWIVYPKGRKDITESDVIGRAEMPG